MAKKYIVTVLGKDSTGLVAQVSDFCWKKDLNIEEIKQEIIDGNFFMLMSVDAEQSKSSFKEIQDGLVKMGEKIGLQVVLYDTEIFKTMHRV